MEIINILGISFITSLFTNGISYLIQRKHKIADAFKTEKNKKIVSKSFENEVKLFEIVNMARKLYIGDSQILISYANQINMIRSDNFLFINETIYNMCKEFSDYLLQASVDSSKIDKQYEQKFIHKFKDEFRK